MTHVAVERSESVGTITLARPERHNALDVRMAQDLRRAALGLARDDAIRAVVLRGAPGVFCSGVDLRYVREGGEAGDLGYLGATAGGGASAPSPGAVFKQVLEYLNATISEIRRAPKPFLAAIDGVAAAGGLGLALCCDLVVASERASFEWAYGKTALSGAESATFFLPRLVGLQRAARLAYLGERVGAAAALRMGLVAEVLPEDGFDAAVAALARRLAAGPARAQARMKALLQRAAGGDTLEDHLDAEIAALVASADDAEFAEGLERFFTRKRG